MASIRPEAGRGYTKRDGSDREGGDAEGGLLEEFPVLGDVAAPLRGDVEFIVDRIHRADRNAVSAVDAGCWVDVILSSWSVVEMQSTGQTSTQEASLTPVQGSVITKGIPLSKRTVQGLYAD